MNRSTKQPIPHNQRIVLHTLRRRGRPMTAYQILDSKSVQARGLKAPPTIYRALDALIGRGLVHRIESLNAFVVCDHAGHGDPPAFVICNDCNRSQEVATRSIMPSLSKMVGKHGFQIENIQIEISGRCSDCAK